MNVSAQTSCRRAAGWRAVVAGAGLLMTAGAALAGDVYWSVGVHSPGIGVGVSNAPPVMYAHPAPVVVMPAPRVVYAQPSPTVVYAAPSPQVIYVPAPTYVVPGAHYKHKKHKHHRHWHEGHSHSYGGHVRYGGGWRD